MRADRLRRRLTSDLYIEDALRFCAALEALGRLRRRPAWVALADVGRHLGLEDGEIERLARTCEEAGLVRYDLSSIATRPNRDRLVPSTVCLEPAGWGLLAREKKG